MPSQVNSSLRVSKDDVVMLLIQVNSEKLNSEALGKNATTSKRRRF